MAQGAVRLHLTMVPRDPVTEITKSAPFLEHRSEDFYSVTESGKLRRGKLVELRSEVGNAPLAGLLQQAGTFGSGANPHAAGVVGIGRDLRQPAASQASCNAGHGGRLDLLGGGQFAQRFRATEDEHRERGQARRAFARGDVLLAHTAQQVDGGGVQAVGDHEDVGVAFGM